MEKLLLGYIVGSFSLDGTVKILSKTNLGHKRYKIGNTVLLCKDDEIINQLTISSYRPSGEFDFVKFEEIKTKEEADSYKSYSLMIEKDSSILDKDNYFFSDLEKCDVISKGEVIGKVIRVEEFPAQITLRIKHKNGKEFFVPFVKAFINGVSIENKQIDVNIIEGMLWELQC